MSTQGKMTLAALLAAALNGGEMPSKPRPVPSWQKRSPAIVSFRQLTGAGLREAVAAIKAVEADDDPDVWAQRALDHFLQGGDSSV